MTGGELRKSDDALTFPRSNCMSTFKVSCLLGSITADAFGATIIAAADIRSADYTQQLGGLVSTVQNSGLDCAARLTKFVEALDREMGTNPSTAGPILQVLQMHFPIERCDIDETFKISRQSKFFRFVSSHTGYYTFEFNNGGFFDSIGFVVSFGLSKRSGNLIFPSASPNKQWISR